MAGAGRVRRSLRLREAPRLRAAAAAGVAPEDWRDWAGLPEDVLATIAEKLVAQTEAGWAAQLKKHHPWYSEETIQYVMAKRQREGLGLFVFALVCKGWRKAQLKVGGRLRTRVLSDVILPGRVALVKWALAEGCPRETERGYTMAAAAAQHGHMMLVRWLIKEQGFAMDSIVMVTAACSGNLKLVRWLRGEGCAWGTITCRYAASYGNLEVLQWLRAEGCPWDAKTCNAAAQHGQLETLRWARENGCEWDTRTCSQAAGGGHLEVLQWLRAEGCPWNSETCKLAALHRHLETLRWARENGCDWDAWTRGRAAAELGYTDDLGNLEV